MGNNQADSDSWWCAALADTNLPARTLAILVPGGTVSDMSSTGAPTPLPTHTLSFATCTSRLSSTCSLMNFGWWSFLQPITGEYCEYWDLIGHLSVTWMTS